MVASASPKASPHYRKVRPATPGTITTAVVTAAMRLTNMDHPTGPKCMFRLGDTSILGHLVLQLAHAGMKRIIILCGYMGETLQALIEKECLFPKEWGVQLEFVQLGDAYQQGMVRSILAARELVQGRFLLAMGTRIFDPDLIHAVAAKKLSSPEAVNEICMLVERDHKNMVGVPQERTLGVKMTGETVTALNMAMEGADAIDCGLFAMDPTIFNMVEEALRHAAYVQLFEVLQTYINTRRLVAMPTEGNLWFACDTKESLLEAANQEVLSALCLHGTKEAWNVAKMPTGLETVKREKSDSDLCKENNGDWSSFPVEKWKDAVYTNQKYFGELIEDQKTWVRDVAKHLKLSGRRVTLIEVGSGTGEFLWPVINDFRSVIGLDFNKNFIDYCRDLTPVEHRNRVHFVHGDASKLVQEMKDKAPAHIWDDARVVACVGNTFGIFPDEIKPLVYQQMAELAGKDGFVLIGYWNARCFGDAVQNFYFANPTLCGKFNGENVDFAQTKLCTPSGYCTHWTGVDEARQVLQDQGLEEVNIEEKGKGVLVTARQGVTHAMLNGGHSVEEHGDNTSAALTAEEDLRAQAYYDSDDAFNFYFHVWGGECIHVGLYEPKPAADRKVVLAASLRSLERLFEIRKPKQGARIMDMGSAYGGNARYAAKQFNAMVSCVDLSAKENKVNIQRTAAAGLDKQIWVNGERSFTQTGEPDASFDLVTSQDSFLHAGQYRAAAVEEAARVLKPGGYFVFTDIMESETCDLTQMGPVFQRIHLDDMGSVSKYRRWGEAAGLVFEEFEDHTDQLARHYGTVRKILSEIHASGQLTGKVSAPFVEKMCNGLASWVEQAGNNNLAWGYVVLRKPVA